MKLVHVLWHLLAKLIKFTDPTCLLLKLLILALQELLVNQVLKLGARLPCQIDLVYSLYKVFATYSLS